MPRFYTRLIFVDIFSNGGKTRQVFFVKEYNRFWIEIFSSDACHVLWEHTLRLQKKRHASISAATIMHVEKNEKKMHNKSRYYLRKLTNKATKIYLFCRRIKIKLWKYFVKSNIIFWTVFWNVFKTHNFNKKNNMIIILNINIKILHT